MRVCPPICIILIGSALLTNPSNVSRFSRAALTYLIGASSSDCISTQVLSISFLGMSPFPSEINQNVTCSLPSLITLVTGSTGRSFAPKAATAEATFRLVVPQKDWPSILGFHCLGLEPRLPNLAYVRVASCRDVHRHKGIIALVEGDGINAGGSKGGGIGQGGQGGTSSHIIGTSYSNR